MGTILGAYRYPVKSMQAEAVERLTFGPDGVDGDRAWGVRERGTGIVLTGKRFEPLRSTPARTTDDGGVEVCVSGGDWLRAGDPAADDAVSDLLGRPVNLVRAQPGERAHYLTPPGIDEDAEPQPWGSPPGRFVDAAPVHLLTTASLAAGAALHPEGAWDVRRFRPNLLIQVDGDGFAEDAWVGGSLKGGDVELAVRKRTTRCVIALRAQQDLPKDPEVARSLQRDHDLKLGVYATVAHPGSITTGDTVTITTAAG